jgi:hypothetical protein
LHYQFIINHQNFNQMATFRKVNLEISRGNGYGQYIITATYRGKEVKVRTTNSECFDWLNDDSNKEKHQEAKRYAYNAVVRAYENM